MNMIKKAEWRAEEAPNSPNRPNQVLRCVFSLATNLLPGIKAHYKK